MISLRLASILAGSMAFVFVAAACGGSNGNGDMNMSQESTATATMAMTTTATAVTPDRTFTLQVKNVKFVPDKLTVPVGSVVEIKLENLDATEHDFQVEGLDADVMSGGSMNAEHSGGAAMMVAVHTLGNETGSVVFMANKKGTYNFACTITGHKEAGMVGTLVVE